MRFKGYLEESAGVLDFNSTHIFQMDGYTVNTSKHGVERIFQRNTLSNEQLKKLFQEAIDKLKAGAVRAGEEILFWSKSLHQAFVSKITDPKHIKIITFLPRDKHHISKDSPDTREVVVEGTQYRVVVIE